MMWKLWFQRLQSRRRSLGGPRLTHSQWSLLSDNKVYCQTKRYSASVTYRLWTIIADLADASVCVWPRHWSAETSGDCGDTESCSSDFARLIRLQRVNHPTISSLLVLPVNVMLNPIKPSIYSRRLAWRAHLFRPQSSVGRCGWFYVSSLRLHVLMCARRLPAAARTTVFV